MILPNLDLRMVEAWNMLGCNSTQLMKPLLTSLLLAIAGSTCSGQGSVTFRNGVAFQTPDPTGGNRLVYDCGSPLDPVNGVALTGTQFVAELYAGTSAASLTPVTASISRFRSSTMASKGKWDLQTVNGVANDPLVLPGNNFGTTAFLQVKVWNYDANGGPISSFETAFGAKEQSIVFTYKVPIAGDPLLGDYYMEGFQAFGSISCPEPSV